MPPPKQKPIAPSLPFDSGRALSHFADASIDTGVGTGIAPFEAALKANNKTYEKFEYKGAQHGFHNDTTPRYDEKAATESWTRTLAFFNKNLR